MCTVSIIKGVISIRTRAPATAQRPIHPIRDWPSRRLFVVPGRSWRGVIKQLRREVANGPGDQQLVQLARRISCHPLAPRLFASTCMFNLVLSDTPDFHSINGLLHICYKSSRRQFWFHYIGLDDQQEYLACPPEAALRTFSSLVQAKFNLSRTFPGDRPPGAVFLFRSRYQNHS